MTPSPAFLRRIAQKMETGCAESQQEVTILRAWADAWDRAAVAWGQDQLQQGKREECEPECGRVKRG